MAFLDFIFGRPGGRQERDLYDPEQMRYLDQLSGQIGQLLPMGLDNLRNLLSNDPSAIDAYTRPAVTDLYQRILPGVAERFTGAGTGSFRSSAFGQEIGQAVTGLEENLAAQRYQQQQQALQTLLGLLNVPLTPRRGFYNLPRQPGFLEGLFGGLLGGR